jgi:hypothetical protein
MAGWAPPQLLLLLAVRAVDIMQELDPASLAQVIRFGYKYGVQEDVKNTVTDHLHGYFSDELLRLLLSAIADCQRWHLF